MIIEKDGLELYNLLTKEIKSIETLHNDCTVIPDYTALITGLIITFTDNTKVVIEPDNTMDDNGYEFQLLQISST